MVEYSNEQVTSSIKPTRSLLDALPNVRQTAHKFNRDKKQFLLLILAGFLVAAVFYGRSWRILLTKPAVQKDEKVGSIYYTTTTGGEEFLCWDGGCAWTRESTVKEFLHAYPPALVTKNISEQDIASKSSILKYRIDSQETYSQLKPFLITKEMVLFSMTQQNESQIYIWKKNEDEAKKIFASTEKYITPLSLDPTQKILLAGVTEKSTLHKSVELFNLETKIESGEMQLATFKWGDGVYSGTEDLGFDAKLPEITCPLYVNITNCAENVRRKDYYKAQENQTNVLDLKWISLSLPYSWEYSSSSGIAATNTFFSFPQKKDLTEITQNFDECFTRTSQVSGKATNKRSYRLQHFTLKKTCQQGTLPQELLVLQHGEFENGKLYIAVSPKLDSTKGTKSDIQLFIQSLKKSVVY